MKSDISFLFLVLAVLMLSSCKKEEELVQKPQVKATVTGYAYADLNLNLPGFEIAPEGTVIHAMINTAQLVANPNPSINYPNKFYQATVGDDGKFTFSIDVGNNPVPVYVFADNFWYNTQINAVESYQNVYAATPSNVFVISSQTVIHNVYFQIVI
jgi:hypothetical protein